MQGFAKDQRGAIVVVAIVVGAVLTGAGFHLLEIQRAITYREQAQTLADAIAGEGAYWHAQGMNLLAFINICMAIILSVFVAVRAAELLAITAAIVMAFIPFVGAGASAAATRVAERMYSLERRITNPIMRALNFGTNTERALAAAFPYIAAAASALKDPPHGLAFGPALFPTAPDRFLRRELRFGGMNFTTFPARMGGRLGADGGRIISRLQSRFPRATGVGQNLVGSLPVEEEDYFQLCKRASITMGNFTFINQIPYAEQALGWLGGNLPGLMCQPLSEARELVENQVREQAEQGARDHCDNEEREWREAELRRRQEELDARSRCRRIADRCRETYQRWRGTYQPPAIPQWSSSRRNRCRDDRRDQLEREGRERAAQIDRSQQASTDTIKTAKLWAMIVPEVHAQNALSIDSPFLHVWSQRLAPVVDTSPRWRFVLPGGRTLTVPAIPAIEANASSAKAAFHHVCTEPDRVECAENSLWRLRWRYKLGVDRDAIEELRLTFGDSIRGYLGYVENQVISRVLGRLLQGAGDRIARSPIPRGAPAPTFRSIWLQRLTGTNLQARNGRQHWAFWGDQVTARLPQGFIDKLYLR